MIETAVPRPRAIALGVQLPGLSEEEHASSLAELARLAKTLGYDVVARVTQKRQALAPGAVVGEGKLEDLVRLAADADAVLVDHEITPSQARNLEKATGKAVLDRTAVILAIFHRHARSREARLQVELARLGYLAPRLRESGTRRDRQGGGIGAKGAGESHVELDRRKLRDRMAELRRELASIEREGGTRRRRRAEYATAALVGYTNAGKSSLMRALTGSPVYVADRLFATLDTTIRAIEPPTQPRILVSDTVGFIKKLPHDLVASFRSTLEEARDADLQLHVVDASDPAFRAQLGVTREVLREIGADGAPVLLVLNKRDRLAPGQEEALAGEFPEAILVSAKQPDDVARLRERILAFFEQGIEETELHVPYARQKLLSEIHESCRVLSETHDELGTSVRLRARTEQIGRLRTALAAGETAARR